MSRQTCISLAILLLAFCSGIGVGLYFGTSPSTSAASGKVVATSAAGFSSQEAQKRVEQNTVLSARILELEKELDAKKGEKAADTKNRLEFFRKYRNKGISITAFDSYSLKGVKLNDAMVDVLMLSKQEREAVEQHLTQAKDEMVALEDNNMNIVKQTPNSVSYEIPPDPNGKAVKDQLDQELANDIGADRAKFLVDYSDFSSGMSMYANFGAQKINVQVGWTTQAGKQLYTWKISTGNGSTWNDTPSEFVPDGVKKYLPVTASP